jgi:hypothetical protein
MALFDRVAYCAATTNERQMIALIKEEVVLRNPLITNPSEERDQDISREHFIKIAKQGRCSVFNKTLQIYHCLTSSTRS